jgi:hypothetical protein
MSVGSLLHLIELIFHEFCFIPMSVNDPLWPARVVGWNHSKTVREGWYSQSERHSLRQPLGC